MTDKSELEKAAEQFSLELYGEIDDCQYGDVTNKVRHLVNFAYEQGKKDAASQDRALWLLEQLFDYQREQQNYSTHFPGQAERMIGINDVIRKAKELCGV